MGSVQGSITNGSSHFSGALEALRHHKTNNKEEQQASSAGGGEPEAQGDHSRSGLGEPTAKKKSWRIEEHLEDEEMISKIRQEVQRMQEKAGLSLSWVLKQLTIGKSTYYRWLNWKATERKGYVHPFNPLISQIT